MSDANVQNARKILRLAVLLLMAGMISACATTHADYRPAPGSYFTAAVLPGESFSSLAERYQVEEDDIVALNGIRDPDMILAGNTIRLPAYGHLRDPRYGPEAATKRTQIARAPATVATPRPRPEQYGARATPVKQERSWWDGWLSSPDTAQATDENFVWPVKGRVLSSFGSDGSGERNDGINISAQRGAPIRAAADGVVTYVGNELKGYGNLVLIRHDNGYVTAYAHADSVIVNRGQRVSQGQTIGYAGSTGDVDQPQLHFEIRQGTKPVDPRRYLIATS